MLAKEHCAGPKLGWFLVDIRKAQRSLEGSESAPYADPERSSCLGPHPCHRRVLQSNLTYAAYFPRRWSRDSSVSGHSSEEEDQSQSETRALDAIGQIELADDRE